MAEQRKPGATDEKESKRDRRDDLALDVKYNDNEPREIWYSHNTFGLMIFEVRDGVAVANPKWDRLADNDLKDGFERWVTAGDVHRTVLRLPFISEIEVLEP